MERCGGHFGSPKVSAETRWDREPPFWWVLPVPGIFLGTQPQREPKNQNRIHHNFQLLGFQLKKCREKRSCATTCQTFELSKRFGQDGPQEREKQSFTCFLPVLGMYPSPYADRGVTKAAHRDFQPLRSELKCQENKLCVQTIADAAVLFGRGKP